LVEDQFHFCCLAVNWSQEMNAKRNRYCLALILCAATLIVSPPLTLCEENVQKGQLRSFLAEGAGLIELRKKLTDDTNKTELLEQKLKQEDADIKKQSEYEKENIKLLQGFNQRLNKEIEHFNAYCKGTFSKDEYEKIKAWCDENELRLAAEQKQSRDMGNAIIERLQKLEERKKRLSEETLNWFKHKKELNGKWEDWQAAQKNWMDRYKGIATSQLVADLWEKSGTIPECEKVLTLEDVHRCLQLLWDRAEDKTRQSIKKGGK
jgi:hypothetical protein